MSKFEKKLIVRACKKYKRIFPCAKLKSFSDCFTRYKKSVIFWFNTEDGSTHTVTSMPENEKPFYHLT